MGSPINIAFIKYWGKTDEELIIPTNDSFSITLSTNRFRTKTSVHADPAFTEDALWLNGERVEFGSSGRLFNVLQAVRASLPSEAERSVRVHVISENNFPTAAGMASSAAGLSALAFALARLLGSKADISSLARIGSGSACRSIYGGFVKWNKGLFADGKDSIATQFVPASHWPEMRILCLVAKAEKKDIPSTRGMRLSVQNSPLMAERISTRVPQRMQAVSEAVRTRDFAAFARITMEDCEDFRAVCRSTTPCVDYWTPRSEAIVALVKAYNAHHGSTRVAYTYDAGANAFIFALQDDVPSLLAYFLHYFPTPTDRYFFEDDKLAATAAAAAVPTALRSVLPDHTPTPLDMVFESPVGAGPQVLENETPLHRPADKSGLKRCRTD